MDFPMIFEQAPVILNFVFKSHLAKEKRLKSKFKAMCCRKLGRTSFGLIHLLSTIQLIHWVGVIHCNSLGLQVDHAYIT